MKTHVSKLMQNIVKQSQSCARILLSWQKKLTQNITVNGKRPKFEVAINTRRHSYWHLIVTRQTAWTKYDATDCSSMWHVYTSVENEAKQHHTTTHTITTRINPKFNKLCNKCIILWNSYKTNHNKHDDTVRNLGVMLDSRLTMSAHTSAVCRSCFFQLRQLRTVKQSLTSDAVCTGVCPLQAGLLQLTVGWCCWCPPATPSVRPKRL